MNENLVFSSSEIVSHVENYTKLLQLERAAINHKNIMDAVEMFKRDYADHDFELIGFPRAHKSYAKKVFIAPMAGDCSATALLGLCI